MYKRSDKVAEAIHELVSGLLVKGLKDPRIGFVTITGVKVSDDIRHATIYYTVMGSDEAKKSTLHGLNSSVGFIRKEVSKELRLRFAPELIFKYDESIEYGNRIDQLLKEIGSEEGGND
ncbi:ribosome-binding factor A [Geobacter metallireducens RCH3]|uniref:Ribosome-binding factor A n=1 Tax=Geobacter metallireducens (strain ATCC 53774 / DSM 7210 / GS-15) TaxID=269799 RepID=RBFA_GEOMG|nr:ribosome-binding factor A [Geobacter metallireducens]Q39VA5.1 RecName: Full=Ribosome-binding factor A [Geobacter metallireducens GS-15]ABB31819.1 ribosome-binding factor A [Geobacter metallireducens GS-15]EHP89299.1 ribosome-binding factor A [Geobacter metallireducens RCH3]